MKRAFVGLGANLGDREATLGAAIALLEALDGVQVDGSVRISRDGTCRATSTSRDFSMRRPSSRRLSLRASCFRRLLDVERALGRTRDGPRYGPRTIDLDLLLVDGLVVEEPGLTVPHPRLHERRFALEPLAELDPQLDRAGSRHGGAAASAN